MLCYAFQIVSLRLIALQILRAMPSYQLRKASIISQGLRVPGEVGDVRFDHTVRLLVTSSNRGASEVAEELETSAREMQAGVRFNVLADERSGLASLAQPRGRRSFAMPSRRRQGTDGAASAFMPSGRRFSRAHDTGGTAKGLNELGRLGGRAESVSEPQTPRRLPKAQAPTHVLLYLQSSTFVADGGATAEMLRHALDAKVPPCIVQEMDPEKGGCAFRQFHS
jgi:hypothetical protein